MDVHLTGDAETVTGAAGGFLASRPVEHNLVATLLQQRLVRPEPGRYAWVVEGDRVLGVFFQSPLDLFGTATAMPRAAASALASALAAEAGELPGFNADAAASAAFAGAWATILRVSAAPVETHRLYRCDSLRPPAPVQGQARVAARKDFDLVAEWNVAFREETDAEPAIIDGRADTERAYATRQLWLWEDGPGQPTCFLGCSPAVAGVRRIGPVYTSPERRRRGFAAALVGHVTGQILDGGDTAALFTELANPTSNAVYQRLGYEPVTEFLRYRFG